jgi:protein TonB
MSDPRPTDPSPRPTAPPPRPGDPPPAEPPRKNASPLIWILLLIALIAFAWYFYSQRAPVTPPAETTPPAADIGSQQEAAAEQEREAAAARKERQREKPAQRRVPADRDPSPLARTQPEYPAAALRAREEGTVLVRVEVDASGNPTNVGIAKRSGSRDLDRAAMAAVRKWKFEPAMKDGKAVASTVQVPVDFTLEEQ